MRVLHVIPAVARRYGGPSFAIRGMAEGVARLGAEVTVATTNADGAAALDVPLDRVVEEQGVAYRYFARTLPGEWKFSWPLTRWLTEHVGDYDVVHVHALFSYATIPACRSARRTGVPYIVRPLGTLAPWSLSQRGWKKAPYLALVERSHLRDAAAIHVTAPAEADAVAALGYGHLARVIPLGVDAAGRADLAARPAERPVRVLFLSRLHPKKGLPLLFDAVRQLPAVELVVAGRGEPAYEAELRALAERLGIAGQVTFAGHVEGDAKRQLFEQADLFALPSHDENFGIAVAEALAAGLPVIVSDQVAIAADVVAADAGLAVPLEVAPLRDALAALAADRARRVSMGARAAHLAASRYSWTRTSELLLQLYEDVAPRARRRQHAPALSAVTS